MRRYRFLRAWIRALELFGIALMVLGTLAILYGFLVPLVASRATSQDIAWLWAAGVALIALGAGELLGGQAARVVLDIRDFSARQARLLREVRDRLPRRPLPPLP